MKKLVTFILMLAVFASLLLSCSPEDGNSGGENSGNGENGGTTNPPVAESTVLWSENLAPTIIVAEQDGFLFENQLATHIFDVSGNIPSVRPATSESVVREISLGNTGSELSVRAYNRLDDIFNLSLIEDNGDSAWLILATEGKIAIAYTDTFAKKAAVDHIVANLTSETYAPKSGVVAKGSFKTVEYLHELREEYQAPMFAEIASVLGENGAAALKKLYALYDEDLYIWFANLYCPDVGGFYYSASARDNEGFLPDLESTAQGLGTLERSGLASAYENNWTKMLPYEISENILAFAKGLQDESGWFYHPQWGTGITDSRRGRDSGWAKSIIKAMGATPNYTYATEQEIETVSGFLTGRFESGSAVVAVSKVVAVAADYSKYESVDAFIAYLDSLKISQNSYSAGNTLNSTSGMIKKYGLRDVLEQYLIDHQNKDNGLWEDEISYQSVNGLMKLCGFFGKNFPNAEKAMASAIQILKRPLEDEITGITYVYNPWYAINHLLSAVSEQTKTELRTMLHKNAADIFQMTFEKLGAFSKPDGGFSYGREFSAPYSQEALVAVSGSVESDVNATSIAVTTVVEYIAKVYGLVFPTIYCKYDSIYFLDTLAKMDTIIKNRVEDPVVDTFDEFDESDGQIDANVVMRPGEYINNKIGDGEGDSYGYKWFESSIVPNPAPGADPKDLVLHVADKVYPNEDKSVATDASNTEFRISNFSVPGNCYVFETDMWIESVEDTSKPIAQLTFVREGSALISSWVDFYQYKRFGKDYIRIQDYSASFAGADGIRETELASGIPVDEWFKLRVELYKDYSGEGGVLTIYLKIYINGVLVSVSDTGHYDTAKGAYKDFAISAIRLSYYRHGASSIYLNNVYAAKTGDSFALESGRLEEDGDISDNKHIFDFEDGNIPNSDENFTEVFYKDEDFGFTSINAADWTDEHTEKYGTTGGVKISVANDLTNATNKVLKAQIYNTDSSSYKATTYIDDTQLAAGGKTYEIEFDYFFERISWTYASDIFSVNILNDAGASLAAVTFTATDFEANHNTATILDVRIGDNLIDNVKVMYDRWYTFKMVYYYNPESPAESRMVIYVLHKGEYVCIANDVLPCKISEPSRVGLSFHCYKTRSTQYIDDLSVSRTDAVYSHIVPSPGIMYEIPIEIDKTEYVTESSRGKGVYAKNSITYSNASYQNLVSGGYMAKNIARGDGTEITDKIATIVRKVSVSKVDGNQAFVYSSLGSANTAVNFVSRANAYGGFVFETDIKLSGVDNLPGREIRFTGTTTNGKYDSALWAFSIKFSVNPNAEKGGYIITVANGDKAVGIPDNTWVNIRAVAEGVEAGSVLRFYVNGVEMITTTLSSSIAGIKGVELYTPSSGSGHGWEQGSIALDNTYVSGTGTPPPTTEVTESSRGEGKYAEVAVKYDGKTYLELVSEGLLADNEERGNGVDKGNRELGVKIDHLRYASVGSGNHAFKFLSGNKAYGGFVFETDILLSGVDATETRAISFVGSSSKGDKDNHLNAFKINIYANFEKEGTYFITIANKKDRVVISDNSWTNLRLEAEGLGSGSKLKLYVNGELMIESTLSADISLIKSVELYTPSDNNGDEGWKNGEILLDNTYASGTGDPPPTTEVTESSRGEGKYAGVAVKYDGKTYLELVSEGLLADNNNRGNGVDAGNRELSVNNDHLRYASIGSGNHAFRFLSANYAYGGYIFETDILLSGVDATETRTVSFVGSSSKGKNDNHLHAFKINIYANPEKEGTYFITIANKKDRVVISDNSWTNLRLEAEGLGSGSKLKLYVNGKLTIESTLSADISTIKSVELYTPSDNNGEAGWKNGEILLDNTYATGTGNPPPTHEITTSSRGEGKYAEVAVKYDGKTYQELVTEGLIADNKNRGNGVDKGNRELGVNTDHLRYASVGSGNHAFRFLSANYAYGGYIFETDILLSGVDTTDTRKIYFVGSSSKGKNDNYLHAFKINICANPEKEGTYLITVANSKERVVISDNSWTNLRLVAEGIDKGSKLKLYVNGKLTIESTLSAEISTIKSVELYTPSDNNGDEGWKNGEILLDNTYATGTGNPPPTHEITTSSRGEGKYAEVAVKYDGKTYQELVTEGLLADNKNRGNGVDAGRRELDVNGDHLRYASIGSGNHAFRFLSANYAYDGYIFETDILLSGVDTTDTRKIYFVGSSSKGKNDNHLNAFKINIYANPEKEGTYLITVANSKQRVVISDNSWTNLRLVAEGIDKGSKLKLYVNGKLTIESTLSAEISTIKSVELYTPSDNNGDEGWKNGEILLDNTYATGTGNPPPTHEITTSSRGEGEYVQEAIKYDGKTYQELVTEGLLADNKKRGNGVGAGNRELDVNGDHLRYASIGSGNHAFRFLSVNKAYEGYVFETDILLSGVDTTDTRKLYFVGSSSEGDDDNHINAFKINICANPEKEGTYVVTIANSKDRVVIRDGSWTNLRLVASGFESNAKLSLYVNGELMIESKFNADISAIKSVELYTPSDNNGDEGWKNGEILLDNTYAGDVKEIVTPPDNGSGGNLDGDGWDD